MSEPEAMSVEELVESEARSLLAHGKKCFLLQMYDEAQTYLAQACSAFARIYGETAFECGEPYLIYGKALIEVARLEDGVIGDAIAGDVDDDDDDASDDDDNVDSNDGGKVSNTLPDCVPEMKGKDEPVSLKDKCDDVSGERMRLEKNKLITITEGDDMQSSEGNVRQDDVKNEMMLGEGSTKNETPEFTSGDNSNEGDTKVADEDIGVEDMSTLHLAWEMIECARCIFLKNANDQETNLKVAEAYLQLGMIGLERETYDQAVEDFLQCLKIQEEHSASDRLIAETYFTLGLAHSMNMNIDASKESYSTCLKVLEKILEELEKRKYENLQEGGTEEKDRIELESLILEVKEHIKELDDTKSESYVLARKLLGKALYKDCYNEGPTEITHLEQRKEKINDDASFSNSSEEQTSEKIHGSKNGDLKVASDISHLVRKKRKADEVTGSSSVDLKVESDESTPTKVQKTG